MVPANMLMAQPITAQRDDGREGDGEAFSGGRDTREEPGDGASVSEGEDEFVDYAVDAYGAGDEGEGGVWGVAEDEVVGVEGG